MKITELLLTELDQEAVGIRKTLQNIPEGKNDWKPHEKSMPLGNLATIVANIPAWLDMVVNMDEIDINPPGGPKFKPQPWKTRSELLEQFENSLKKGREVLQKTTDDRLLNTKWRMLYAGKLMMEQTRYEAIREAYSITWPTTADNSPSICASTSKRSPQSTAPQPTKASRASDSVSYF
jgi:hypothetical protein